MTDSPFARILQELGMSQYVPKVLELGVDFDIFNKVNSIHDKTGSHLRMSVSTHRLLCTEIGFNQAELVTIINTMRERGIKPQSTHRRQHLVNDESRQELP